MSWNGIEIQIKSVRYKLQRITCMNFGMLYIILEKFMLLGGSKDKIKITLRILHISI